jgi:hypothetical protein
MWTVSSTCGNHGMVCRKWTKGELAMAVNIGLSRPATTGADW